jgi:hypothetical protein
MLSPALWKSKVSELVERTMAIVSHDDLWFNGEFFEGMSTSLCERVGFGSATSIRSERTTS